MNNPTTIMFDLDDTLAESKAPLTPEMGERLALLLGKKKVAIISGAGLPQFLKQVVDRLPSHANLSNLYLMPTCGAALYAYEAGEWKSVYVEHLAEDEARAIESILQAAAEESGVIDFSGPSWGERIEYRGSQVSLSALGQQAPVEEKKAWDPDHAKRQAIVAIAAPQLSGYSLKIGGATTIDVTKEGIDKAFGVRKLSEYLQEPISAMLFVGDALFPGGNDEIVKESGIETKEVKNPSDTAELIEELLSASVAVPAG
jgi:phosphomannomutase